MNGRKNDWTCILSVGSYRRSLDIVGVRSLRLQTFENTKCNYISRQNKKYIDLARCGDHTKLAYAYGI